ncbi:MAG TPA: NAD(P)/FAD-dependent oxidoreductase [Acidobacteriota bacterium]
MRIAIIGAGPAGSLSAQLFAGAGHEVKLFERKPGREKACGGGFTARALQTCPLPGSGIPRNSIAELELIRGSRSTVLRLDAPFHVYARAHCDSYLMDRAIEAGASLQRLNVTEVRRVSPGWEVIAGNKSFRVDWLVGADGSHSRVRTACSEPLELADLSMTFGYYLPGQYHPGRAVVALLPRYFEGYLWSFPRTEHSSVGVINTARHSESKTLRKYVDNFLDSYYHLPPPAKDKIYGALVPTLREATLRYNRCAGEDWALIGDAGGFVDSITGEGIYFSLRSAQLLSEVATGSSLKKFDEVWRDDFGDELVRSARLKRRFYCGRRWYPSYAEMLIPITRRSATARKIERDYIAGRQGYVGLKHRILRAGPRIIAELLIGN